MAFQSKNNHQKYHFTVEVEGNALHNNFRTITLEVV